MVTFFGNCKDSRPTGFLGGSSSQLLTAFVIFFFQGIPVVDLKVVRRQSDSLFLEWQLLSDGATNSYISHYTLQYHTDHSNGGIERTIRISSEKTNYQLHDLQPYTKYTIELFATNKHFSSETSQVEAMTTEAGKSDEVFSELTVVK